MNFRSYSRAIRLVIGLAHMEREGVEFKESTVVGGKADAGEYA